MQFAVQLCFTDVTQAHLTSVFQKLDSPVTRRGDRPHLTLAVCEAADDQGLRTIVDGCSARHGPFAIKFAGIGMFPGAEEVVYLTPIVTQALMAVHSELHDGLACAEISSSTYYRPNHWVPHVGVSMGSKRDKERLLESLWDAPVWDDYWMPAIELVQISPGKLLQRWRLG